MRRWLKVGSIDGAVGILLISELAVPASTAVAGATINALLLIGDPVEGVGDITQIQGLSVGDTGDWAVLADTNHPDTSADIVVVRNDSLFAREGEALEDPTGATIDAFTTVEINENGELVWPLDLAGVPVGQNAGAYVDTTLIVQLSALSIAPELPAGSLYSGIGGVTGNDSNQVLLGGTVDVPGGGNFEQLLAVVDYDARLGRTAESVVARWNDPVAGFEFGIETIHMGFGQYALNDAGSAICVVDLLDLTSIVLIDDTVIMAEGVESPISGLDWGHFGSVARVGLNASGSYVVLARLATSLSVDDVIVSDGAVVAREGDPAPGIPGRLIDGFDDSVFIGDNGSVLWFGDLEGNTNDDTALFLDDEPIVREGVTVIDGAIVDSIKVYAGAFAMSASGSHMVFAADLSDGRSGAFMIELAPAPCPADLDHSGSIDFADLLLVLGGWGPCSCTADIDGNGAVDFNDLLLILGGWGPCG